MSKVAWLPCLKADLNTGSQNQVAPPCFWGFPFGFPKPSPKKGYTQIVNHPLWLPFRESVSPLHSRHPGSVVPETLSHQQAEHIASMCFSPRLSFALVSSLPLRRTHQIWGREGGREGGRERRGGRGGRERGGEGRGREPN